MPSYGAHDAADPDARIVRGQAKAGTTHHYRCATAYGIVNHDRVTLAVVFMRATDTLPSVVERLLTIVRAAGYRIGCLYADKGFCRVAVIRYLQAEQVLAVIAALIQGGTRALYQGNKSSWTRYTFSSHKAGSVTVQLAVVRRFAKRRGKKRGVWCLFVSLGVGYDLMGIREAWRKRFGIESSSRIAERLRVRTASRSAGLRFLLIGVALVLQNGWITIQRRYLRRPGREPRRGARDQLRLLRFCAWLADAVTAI